MLNPVLPLPPQGFYFFMELTYWRTEEHGRLERLEKLHQVLKIADDDICNYIERLHDHKGCLVVTWLIYPDDGYKEIIQNAWGLFFETEVEHKYSK